MKALSTFFSSVGQWLFLGLVVLLPVVYLPVAWATVPHAKMLFLTAVVGLGVLVWIAARLLDRNFSLPGSIVLIAGILLPVAYLVSALFATTSGPSLVGTGVDRDTVAAMLLWFGAMAGAAVFFATGPQVVRAYRWLLVAVGVVAVLHLARLVFGPEFLSFGGALTGPAASIVGSWHDLGIFLGLGVLLSAALLDSPFNVGFRKLITYSVLVLSFVLLIVVNARDVWFALTALSLSGALYLLFLRMRRGEAAAHTSAEAPETSQSASEAPHTVRYQKTLIAFVIIGVISLAMAFVGNTIHENLPERLQVIQIEVRPSWEGTIAVAGAVYGERSILFGTGPNTFARQWGLYKPAGVNETAFWNAAFAQGVGFIPTSFITVGLLGAIAWILFFGAFLYAGFRVLWKRNVQNRWQVPLFALFAGALYLWVMHVVYPPGITLMAITFLLTGIFIAAQRAAGATILPTWNVALVSVRGMATLVVVVIFGLAAIVSTVAITRALAADMLVNQAIVAYNQTGNRADAEAKVQRALVWQSNNDRALRASAELELLRFAELASSENAAGSTEELQQSLTNAIQYGLSAVSANSESYQNWITLARTYEQLAGVEIEGAYENAVDAYEQAYAGNPTNPEPLLLLARLFAVRGDLASARDYLNQALGQKQNYAAAHLLLSQIEATEGNLEAAIEAAANAVASEPREPVVWYQLGVLSYENGNLQDAAAALEQAVILNANYANALYVLGTVYIELGRTEEAIAAFERVEQLNPGNQAVLQILNTLRPGSGS